MAKKVSQVPTKGPVIYQAKNGAIALRGDASRETVWATQAQIAIAFDVDIRTVNEHIQNIYKTKELGQKTTIRKFRIVQTEGKRVVERDVMHYDLDMILSVGYRVNSKRATQFRQWATKTLRSYIVEGYVVDRRRLGENYATFEQLLRDAQRLLPADSVMRANDAMELVSFFANTWLSLDAYDKEAFTRGRTTKKKITLTAESFLRDVQTLKAELMRKEEATELFATERTARAVEGIIGNVMQSFGGSDVYPSLEEKAAHLLYFVVKNHPFVDGNKRTGAYAFVWFLSRAKILDRERISPSALTAITLLVAESDPKDKERLIGLITMMLGLPR
jgi:prophage maintenance system killer protein